jgi:glycosyltransferase involved in cell wall biosynthesis
MTEVSIVIPTRDRWSLLERTVRSVLSQADITVDVIVVDDGSVSAPPYSPTLQDPRVRLIRHPQVRGTAAARNTGVEAAGGEWLAWLDDDDLWAPRKLARQLACVPTADTALAYAGVLVVNDDLRPIGTWPAPSPVGLAEALVADVQMPAGSSNVLARRAAVIACGGFDTSLDHLADWDMWLRLAREGPAVSCDELLVAYVVHGANRHLGADGLMDEFDRVQRKHAAWAQSVGADFDRARFSQYPIRLLTDSGRRREALALAADCLVRRPIGGNLRIAAGGLAGPRALRAYRRITRRSAVPATAPAWLADIRRSGTD